MLKFLKWVVILGVVVGGGAWVYGRGLPQEHVAVSTVVLVAPVDTVWRVIRNIEATPRWWPDMKSARRAQGYPRETWEQQMGAAGTLKVEITSALPGRNMITTIVDTEGQGWGGVWTYEVAATAAGTEVTIIEEGWVDAPILRVVMKWRGKHRTMDRYLRSLGAHFGEMVTPRRG
jgi:uncharacterized protein YndB with AHSA1/START domain